MEKKTGYYAGTEIDGKWWRRYRHDGYLIRGNGEFWVDDKALVFRRYLVNPLIRIQFEQVDDIMIGMWHAGRWAMSKRMIKIRWTQNGQHLCAGFVLARNEEESRQLVRELSKLVEANRSASE